jgi:hypothetical protein
MCLLALGIGALLSSCGGDSATAAPKEIVGTWVATGDLYAGRSLEISTDRLYFGTGGEEDPEVFTIVRVRREAAEGCTLYSIEYQSSDGGEFTLPINFYRETGVLRLANRTEVVWKLGEHSTKNIAKNS